MRLYGQGPVADLIYVETDPDPAFENGPELNADSATEKNMNQVRIKIRFQ